VLVRRPDGSSATLANANVAVPTGSEVDASGGRVRVTTELTTGRTQRAELSGGRFIATQDDDGLVELRLSEKLAPCSKRPRTEPKSRKLSGDGKGRYRMLALTATVTVRGGRWYVQDSSCGGTKARVSRGVAAVRSRARHKTVLVRSGRSYTVKPKRR
jgi:hypothetical protein